MSTAVADRTDVSPPGLQHVVALGASAGGLEALEGFFDHTPADTGLAFVVIQHLSPDYKSLMVELLSRHTRMRVARAEHGMPLEPDTVFLIPPKNNMTVRGGLLQLSQQTAHTGVQLPIDLFFRSLAAEYGDRAVGVILSGTGSDGMRGVRAIKEAGGLVAVQDEAQARFDGMPRSAIATGLVDLMLPVEHLPSEIISQLELRAAGVLDPAAPQLETDATLMRQVADLLRQHSGVDFSLYKPATVTRRLERRMAAAQCRQFADYVRQLEQSPREREALFRELLIGVTRFFRDPAAFEVLRERVVPEIVAGDGAEPVRVWVPACSTGEEAYSLAILLREQCEDRQARCQVKIFATDVDKEAVAFAAAGLYPEGIAADVSEGRLARYFTRVGDQYQVNRSIREMVVFAYQNLGKDPPFTRMSLVSCRNLLIYLQPVLQRKVLALLTYALRPGGFLFLGPSESLGHIGGQYQTVDSRWKVYRAVQDGRGSLTDILSLGREAGRPPLAPARPARLTGDDVLVDRVHQELVRALEQTCFVVDSDFRLLHCYGNTTGVLAVPPGRATLDLLRMVRPELATAVRAALMRVAGENQEVRYPVLPADGTAGPTSLRVRPIPPIPDREPLFLIILEGHPEDSAGSADPGEPERARHLETELQHTRENLQATIEELETSNEELQATNEELVAANEELQSTNEELQSVNEELQTVNAEYQQKIEELTQLNNDIDNMLRVTEVGLLFVDESLHIRKFTPSVSRVLHVIPQDLGRPLDHLSSTIPGLDLVARARAVLADGAPSELEVRLPDDKHLRVRFLPYLADGTRRGVVVNLLDVTADRQRELRSAEVLNSHPAHLAVLDRTGTIVLVNRAWERFARENGDPNGLHTGPGSNYLDVCQGSNDPVAVAARAGLEAVLTGKAPDFALEYPCHGPDRRRWFVMRVFPIGAPAPGAVVWHLDVTDRREAEDALAASARPTP